jgi:hypothetical protein
MYRRTSERPLAGDPLVGARAKDYLKHDFLRKPAEMGKKPRPSQDSGKIYSWVNSTKQQLEIDCIISVLGICRWMKLM